MNDRGAYVRVDPLLQAGVGDADPPLPSSCRRIPRAFSDCLASCAAIQVFDPKSRLTAAIDSPVEPRS